MIIFLFIDICIKKICINKCEKNDMLYLLLKSQKRSKEKSALNVE